MDYDYQSPQIHTLYAPILPNMKYGQTKAVIVEGETYRNPSLKNPIFQDLSVEFDKGVLEAGKVWLEG